MNSTYSDHSHRFAEQRSIDDITCLNVCRTMCMTLAFLLMQNVNVHSSVHRRSTSHNHNGRRYCNQGRLFLHAELSALLLLDVWEEQIYIPAFFGGQPITSIKVLILPMAQNAKTLSHIFSFKCAGDLHNIHMLVGHAIATAWNTSIFSYIPRYSRMFGPLWRKYLHVLLYQ